VPTTHGADQTGKFRWPLLRSQPFNLASPEDVVETLASLKALSSAIDPIPHVSPEEVCLQIRNLQRSKASGFDGVDSRTAKT